ncbi:hypothetical protein TKK_0004714 [Trichogramma kaykai]
MSPKRRLLLSTPVSGVLFSIQFRKGALEFLAGRTVMEEKKKTCRFHYPMYMMPETRILKAINDEELSGNEPIHIKKIKNLMLQYFNENTDISFIDMLQKLEITETEYINAIRSTLKNKKIFYKRNSLDVSINPYNPTILTLLESNMDLQGVLDAYAAAFYMVNYVTKIDAGLSKLLKEANEDVENGNYNIQQRLAKIANAFINGSVMSAQEAAYQILSLPLCHSTRSSIYINTVPKENRSRILKNKKELENLPKNSTDIFRSNIFDKYEKRLSKYENYCLADFACKFTTHEHITSDELIEEANENETIAKERKKDKILRSVTYKLDQDPNNYYRENVLLYLPFRNEDLDIINKNHKQLYNINKDIILRNKQKYYKINQSEIETALQELDEADESDDETDITTSFRTEDINILQQVGSTTTEKTYKLNFPTLISKEEIFNKINDLNIDQKKIIMHILYSFKTNQLPLRIFLNGSAGVGKSTVINAIYQLLTIYFSELPGENTDNNKILLCAPSGKAAYLIGGVTCHHAFALPITQCGSKMKDLSEDIANTIRSNFQFIKLIIIDEISMVGSNMFHKIDTRLRQIYGVNKSFGGISIITVGDLLQLPPVMDRPIYKYPSSSTLSNLSINKLWDEFKIYTLTKIMRQQNDIPFIHLLNNMAHGTMIDKDFALLDTRITTENNIPQDAIRLFGQNTFVDTYNQKKIAEMPGTIFEVVSKDKVIDSIPENEKQKLIDSLQHKKRQECGGLHNILQLKIGIKYMITKNIDVQDGLVNGAFGLLEWIEFNSAEEPTIAWLNFGNDKSIGRRLKNKYKSTKLESTQTTNLVPITKADNTINTKTGIVIMRTQFPLTPSEALTIHKSQGETYDKACINLTTLNKKFTSTALLYVAFTKEPLQTALHNAIANVLQMFDDDSDEEVGNFSPTTVTHDAQSKTVTQTLPSNKDKPNSDDNQFEIEKELSAQAEDNLKGINDLDHVNGQSVIEGGNDSEASDEEPMNTPKKKKPVKSAKKKIVNTPQYNDNCSDDSIDEAFKNIVTSNQLHSKDLSDLKGSCATDRKMVKSGGKKLPTKERAYRKINASSSMYDKSGVESTIIE